jgi:hypothetical protein
MTQTLDSLHMSLVALSTAQSENPRQPLMAAILSAPPSFPDPLRDIDSVSTANSSPSPDRSPDLHPSFLPDSEWWYEDQTLPDLFDLAEEEFLNMESNISDLESTTADCEDD